MVNVVANWLPGISKAANTCVPLYLQHIQLTLKILESQCATKLDLPFMNKNQGADVLRNLPWLCRVANAGVAKQSNKSVYY